MARSRGHECTYQKIVGLSGPPGAPVASVFETEPCATCGGKAVACPKCLGLGVRVKPSSAPLKSVDEHS